MQNVRRWVQRFAGRGPCRVAPFAAIVATRIDPRQGVHQPEEFNGTLLEVSGSPAVYRPGRSLLHQEPTGETIAGRRRYLEQGIAPGPKATLWALSDAGLLGSDGLVYCPRTRTAVRESMRQWLHPLEAHPALAAPRIPPPLACPGTSLSIGVLDGGGFYHFLIESLPRLWLARSYLDTVHAVYANGGPGSFQAAWLEHAGIPPERVRWLAGLAHFRCEQLLFTNYVIDDYRPTPWSVQATRSVFRTDVPTAPGTRRLWVSRRDARSRQPDWEQTLLARLDGFEPVSLSTLRPAEQIALMRDAAVIAGPHGAGLANLVFCGPGTKVVEIFPNERRAPIYSRLAAVCQLEHAWAVCDFTSDRDLAILAPAINEFANSRRPPG